MAANALDRLDEAGAVLCGFQHRQMSLAWCKAVGDMPGFYAVDWKDERGLFWSGVGDTPSDAVVAALRRPPPFVPLTAVESGFATDA